MSALLWIRNEDEELFREKMSVSFNPHNSRLLTLSFQNFGDLGKFYDSFVFGRIKTWKSLSGEETLFVRVRGNSMHEKGLVITPNSQIDFRYHRRAPTIDSLTPQNRAELISIHPPDFVQSVFETYYRSYDVKRQNEKDGHFLLYRVFDDSDEV
ncbi:MAG: hypothetical protein KKC96_01175 [Nanoarchaeota archaeon]|nr:hypothetical protein [Nanoarchaeota archaeon]MBU2459260.1 hypothetical protein [Nanoarchaeota archaeon]